MISSRYHGVIRLHFVLKLAGGLSIFWGLVWALHFFVYGEELHPGNYHYISLLIPFAAFFEIAVREKSSRSLCGVSRAQIWNVTQREILFTLVAIFGVIVMSKDPALSRVFLAAFMIVYSVWIAWMNQVGHRLLQRRLFSSRSQHANTIVVAPPAKIERDKVLHMTGNLPGAELLGYVPYGGAAAIDIPSFPFLGDFDNIRQICLSYHAKLVLALGLDNNPSIVKMLQDLCDSQGMRLIWVEDQKERFGGNFDSHQSGSHLFLTNWQEALEDPVNRGILRVSAIFTPEVRSLQSLQACLCRPGQRAEIVHDMNEAFLRKVGIQCSHSAATASYITSLIQAADPALQRVLGDGSIDNHSCHRFAVILSIDYNKL